MKSANIMVSSDAGLFITDFGFATVGKFGPPPPLTEKAALSPAVADATDASATATDVVPKLVGSCAAEARACVGAVPSAHSESGVVEANNGKGAGISSRRVPGGDVDGGMVMPAKSRHKSMKCASSSVVLATEEAQGPSDPGDQASTGKGGDIDGAERSPNRQSVLYGTLKGYTPRYQSPEVSAILNEKTKAGAKVAQAGGHPPPNEAPQVGFPYCMLQ